MTVVMYHGTKMEHVNSIGRDGLLAGGGFRSRAHIHLVFLINGRAEIPGVRTSSDVVVAVDMKSYVRDCGQCWRSLNNVLLTQGLEGRREIDIPARYIVSVRDRYTGED